MRRRTLLEGVSASAALGVFGASVDPDCCCGSSCPCSDICPLCGVCEGNARIR